MQRLPSTFGRWTRTLRVVAPLALSLTAAITAAACGAKSGLGFDTSSNPTGGGGSGGIVFGTTGTGGSGGIVGTGGEGGSGGFGTGGILGTGGTGGMIPPPAACADAGQTFIYVITDTKDLYAFDPGTNGFSGRGHIDCAPDGTQSMAVDRLGHAYVESNNEDLYKVSLVDASCTKTAFTANGLQQFGMAFAADDSDAGESLYIADRGDVLATVDVDTFAINQIGTFSKDIGAAELTGTGDGRLFAFGVGGPGGAHLSRINRNNAEVLADEVLQITGSNSWAFAWWGGAFYFFTSDGGASAVHRYDPESNDPPALVATAPGAVVGAGVSTCAPLN